MPEQTGVEIAHPLKVVQPRAPLAEPRVVAETRNLTIEAFRALADIVPRPGHKAVGEERAWGRRLAKRFGAEGRIDDRTFVLSGDGNTSPALDFESGKANGVSADVVAFFKPFKKGRGDTLVAFGWAMAEDLVARANGK